MTSLVTPDFPSQPLLTSENRADPVDPQIPDASATLRESQWLSKFAQQQDKIANLKYRVQMLQAELRSERDQNEQTIESFTVMCQDLKFKGMDEVEDLQSELSIVREQMRGLAHVRAQKELQIEQLTDQVRYMTEENAELSEQLRQISFKQLQEQIDREIDKIAKISSQEEDIVQEQNEMLAIGGE